MENASLFPPLHPESTIFTSQTPTGTGKSNGSRQANSRKRFHHGLRRTTRLHIWKVGGEANRFGSFPWTETENQNCFSNRVSVCTTPSFLPTDAGSLTCRQSPADLTFMFSPIPAPEKNIASRS